MNWSDLFLGTVPFVSDETSEQNSQNWICTELQLLRNLGSYPFLSVCNSREKQEVSEKLRELSRSLGLLNEGRLEEFNESERSMLLERMLWPLSMGSRFSSEKIEDGWIASDITGKNSVVINNQEHFSLRSIWPGIPDMETLEKEVSLLQNNLSGETWAYAPEWGYLTANPKSAGAGFHVISLIHIPGFFKTKSHEKMFNGAAAIGLTGMGMPDLAGFGNMVFISNKRTLAKSQGEILKEFYSKVELLLNEDRQLMENLWKNDKAKVEDKIYRALAQLQSARVLSYPEFLGFSSWVRVGVSLGLFPREILAKLTLLMVKVAPGHIMLGESPASPQNTLDEVRATTVRLYLQENSQ